MKFLTGIKVQADVINGCYLVDNFDDNIKMFSEWDFYDEIHTLTDGTIGAVIDDEIYFKIHNEYRIF